jgi:hypothetical protein
MPNAGVTTPDDRKAKREVEASYAKHPVGVANSGLVTKDDPDKGKDWKHEDEDSVQANVDKELEVKEDEEKKVSKSLDPVGFLKSLNSSIKEELSLLLPNSMEALFMINELAYDPILVAKGQLSISGKDRHRFNTWAHARLSKSLSSLSEFIK